MSTGQDIVRRTPQQEMVARVRTPQFLEQIQLALPGNVTPERFVRATVTALLQNPDLAQIQDVDSLFTSVIRCAQDGLLPDGREAALVRFGSKAQYMPMIGGYRKIAAEHGWTIGATVVYEHDEFDHALGLEQRLVHRPVRPGAERGHPIAAYATARHRDGRNEFLVMTAAEIEQVRQVSRAKDTGPWRDWWSRMWEKTVARRLFTRLPLDPSDRRVASVLDVPDTPGAAAAMLYGPGAGETFRARELEQDTPAHPTPADDGGSDHTPAAVDQQAGTGTPAPADTPSSASPGGSGAAPGEPALDAEPETTAFPLPLDVIEQALATVIPTGKQQGKTLAEVAAHRGGRSWFEFALSPDADLTDEFRTAVGIVYRARYGDAS